MNPYSKRPTDKSPSQMDWARLAAYIDGEGSLGICYTTSPRKKDRRLHHKNVQVSVYTTKRPSDDAPVPPIMDWLKSTFGAGIIARKVYNTKHAQCFEWRCIDVRAAWVIENCSPYFLIKGEQAEVCMEFRRLIEESSLRRGEYVPESVLASREALSDRLHVLKLKGGIAA